MRWFYTDPLAAAWMLKHFGMKFVPQRAGTALVENLLDIWMPLEDEMRMCKPLLYGPYHIHPDSLPLLQPQIGDCLRFPRAITPYVTCKENGEDLTKLHTSFARYKIAQGDCQIIYRDGKQFFWPESEVA